MGGEERDVVTGELLDDSLEFDLVEFCSICHASEEFVVRLVDEGVIEPRGGERARWRFTGASVCRTQVAIRLHQDLDVNLPGVALALDLLDELDRLRGQGESA